MTTPTSRKAIDSKRYGILGTEGQRPGPFASLVVSIPSVVLLTGVAGLLGHNLVECLLEKLGALDNMCGYS